MARHAATNTRRRHLRFQGKKGFEEFLKWRCLITRRLTDVVKRRDLYRAYGKFCAAHRRPVASVVNVGRYLGGLQVWASTRLGGVRGRNQEYAYVGLCLKDDPDEASDEVPEEAIIKEEKFSPPGHSVTPLSPSNSDDSRQSVDPLFTRPSSAQVALSQPSENTLMLFDSFLQEHVECTGSTDDGVAIWELHGAFRRLCRARGVRPPPSATLCSHLAQREGVAISHIPFEIVKRAYLGLRWTNSALNTLTPSRTVQQTPCSSRKAKDHTPTAPGVPWEGNGEKDEWTPWVKHDGLRDQPPLRYWDDDDTSRLLDTLQTVPPPPPPTPASPSTPPDTNPSDLYQGTADLAQLLEAYVDTESCMF